MNIIFVTTDNKATGMLDKKLYNIFLIPRRQISGRKHSLYLIQVYLRSNSSYNITEQLLITMELVNDTVYRNRLLFRYTAARVFIVRYNLTTVRIRRSDLDYEFRMVGFWVY